MSFVNSFTETFVKQRTVGENLYPKIVKNLFFFFQFVIKSKSKRPGVLYNDNAFPRLKLSNYKSKNKKECSFFAMILRKYRLQHFPVYRHAGNSKSYHIHYTWDMMLKITMSYKTFFYYKNVCLKERNTLNKDSDKVWG